MSGNDASTALHESTPRREEDRGGIRPLLRRDVLFGDTGAGAFLRHADDAFVMKGRTVYSWLCALAPLLDGSSTLDELTSTLPDEQRTMLISLVEALLKRGFARDDVLETDNPLPADVREAYAPQIAYIHHFVSEPARRFDRFRRARAVLVASGPFAAATEQMLRDNGMAAVRVELDPGTALSALTEADVLVVNGDDVGLGALSTLATAARAAKVPMIPVLSAGGRAFVGPLLDPTADLGWETLIHRLAAGLDPEEAAELWMRFVGRETTPRHRPARTHAAMLGTLVGFDIFRHLTGCLTPETADAVVVQNLTTLDVVTQGILTHPADPLSPQAPPEDIDLTSLREELDALGPTQAEGDPSGLHQQAERYLDLIRQHCGVFRGFADLADEQSPIKVGRIEIGAVRPSDDSAVKRTVVNGFHVMTPLQARFYALGAAALRYIDTWGPEASRRVLDEVDVVTSVCDGWSGSPVSPEQMHGVWGTSLVTGSRLRVPAAVVYPHSRYNLAGTALRTDDGSGFGGTVAEATRRALFSALSRRAVFDALRTGRPLDEVGLTSLQPGSVPRFLVDSCATLGVAPVVLDASLPRCGRTVVAFSARPDGDRTVAYVATAASLEQATTEALVRLLGDTQVGADRRPHDGPLADLDPLGLPRSGETVALDDEAQTVTSILDSLARSTDIVLVDTTFHDLARGGIRTARVLLATTSDHPGKDAPQASVR